MNAEMQLVIGPVTHREIAKGNIAHGTVEKAVRQVRFFKASDLDSCFLVKLPGHPPGQFIQLDASRMLPPRTPIRSSARYMVWMTSGGVK